MWNYKRFPGLRKQSHFSQSQAKCKQVQKNNKSNWTGKHHTDARDESKTDFNG